MPSTAKGKIASCQTVKDRGLTLPKILPPGTTIQFRVAFKWMIDFHYCDLSEKLEGAPPTHTHIHTWFPSSLLLLLLGRKTFSYDQQTRRSLLMRKQTLSQLPLLPPACNLPHLLTFPEFPRVIHHKWSQTSKKSGGPSTAPVRVGHLLQQEAAAYAISSR